MFYHESSTPWSDYRAVVQVRWELALLQSTPGLLYCYYSTVVLEARRQPGGTAVLVRLFSLAAAGVLRGFEGCRLNV